MKKANPLTYLFIRNQLNLMPCTVDSLASPGYGYIRWWVIGSWYGDLGSRHQFQLVQFLTLWTQHKPMVLLGDTYHCLALSTTRHHCTANYSKALLMLTETTVPPATIRLEAAWRHQSPGMHGWSRLQSNYSPLWSVTDNDDRRRPAKQYCPPTLCVGGSVITKWYMYTQTTI